jgi:enoyl-CoA hydratase/carnithine racemase
MTGTAVILNRRDEVGEIVLNRPQRLNAMNLAWVSDLAAAVAALTADPPEIVLVRGAGRAFCSGMDLDMLAADGMPERFYPLQEEAFRGLEELDRLVVAQVHGYCLGGGLQLALACDLRIASEDTVLGLPAAREGLPPGMAPWRLPRFVGLGRAMRLAVSGEPVDAAEAAAIGLVDHVLPADGFAEGAAALVARYLAVPRAAARATKELIRGSYGTDFATAHARSRELVAECLRLRQHG